MRCLTIVALAAILPATLQAQWSPRGDHEELRGMTIVDIGAFHLETTASARVSQLLQRGRVETKATWVFDGHERRCFDPDFGIGLPESETALFLSDHKGELFLAVFTPSGQALSVEVQPAFPTLCPAGPDSDDPDAP